MILTECTACADERAAGAAFCEVCGRELGEGELAVTLPASPGAAPGDAADADATTELPASTSTAASDSAAGSGAAVERSAKDWMDCPHCQAERAVGADGYCEECGMLAGRPRDHLEADGGAVAAAVSDRGRRHHRNEDAMWLAVGAAAADVVVCDGVSASFDPDAASDIAARTAGELLAAAQHPVTGDGNGEVTTDLSAVADELAAAETTVVADPDKTTVVTDPDETTVVTDPDKTTVVSADPDRTAVLPETGSGSGDETVELTTAAADDDETPDGPAPAESGSGAPGVPRNGLIEEPTPAIAIAGVVAAAIAGAAAAVASLAHTGDPRRATSNPACTIVAAAVRGPHVGFGWVGDSRAYWLTAEGPAEQLTEDDSWARHVIAMGVDPKVAMNDPKAHAITAWLGADFGPVTPRVGAFTVTEPGWLVLCSDGLWNYLPDPAAFADVVRAALNASSGTSPLLTAARALVTYANEAGGADNITVALVPVRPADE